MKYIKSLTLKGKETFLTKWCVYHTCDSPMTDNKAVI